MIKFSRHHLSVDSCGSFVFVSQPKSRIKIETRLKKLSYRKMQAFIFFYLIVSRHFVWAEMNRHKSKLS